MPCACTCHAHAHAMHTHMHMHMHTHVPCTCLALQDLDNKKFFPLTLRIALNGQQYTNPLNYTYQRSPLQPYSLPSSGPTEGNTTIVVFGRDLAGGSQYQCLVGPYLLNATYFEYEGGMK